MQFYKYHGTGNDFIIIERGDRSEAELPALVRKLCHRKFGIGADGLMLAEPSAVADIKMRYWNQDGSVAPMCGNGIRVFTRYVTETGKLAKTAFKVETLAGIMPVTINSAFDRLSVNLGRPRYDLTLEEAAGSGSVHLEVNGRAYDLELLFLGTLHAVSLGRALVPEADAAALCQHPFFPGGINVNFVEVMDRAHLTLKTYERGVGYTLACGTGAASAQVVAHNKGLTNAKVIIKNEGGDLEVETGNGVTLTGPAVLIAKGETEIE